MGRLIGTTTQYSFLPGQTYTNFYGYAMLLSAELNYRTQVAAPTRMSMTRWAASMLTNFVLAD